MNDILVPAGQSLHVTVSFPDDTPGIALALLQEKIETGYSTFESFGRHQRSYITEPADRDVTYRVTTSHEDVEVVTSVEPGVYRGTFTADTSGRVSVEGLSPGQSLRLYTDAGVLYEIIDADRPLAHLTAPGSYRWEAAGPVSLTFLP